jgi:hypothetical protein
MVPGSRSPLREVVDRFRGGSRREVIGEPGQVGMSESPAVSRRLRQPPTLAAASTLTVPALLCTALLLGGCSSAGVRAPNLSATARPAGFQRLQYGTDGVALSVPRNWTVTAESAPLVAVYSSGPATIALWRFPRPGAAIVSTTALRHALVRLIAAARARDPTLEVQHTGLSAVSGAGAVIVDALERVGHQLRRVRTEHVYAAGAELVLDAYAPPTQFASVDHLVFSPVRKSLSLLRGGAVADGSSATATNRSTNP